MTRRLKVWFYGPKQKIKCLACKKPRWLRIKFLNGKVINLCKDHHYDLLDEIDMGGRA